MGSVVRCQLVILCVCAPRGVHNYYSEERRRLEIRRLHHLIHKHDITDDEKAVQILARPSSPTS